MVHKRANSNRSSRGRRPRLCKGKGQASAGFRDPSTYGSVQAQISLLSRQFPASPRVVLLQGLAFEATGEFANARLVYQVLLGTAKDPEKVAQLGPTVKGLDKEGDECFIVRTDA